MSVRLLSVCVLLSICSCSGARLLLDLAAFSPVGSPVYPDQLFPDASAGSPLEALTGSVPAMGASVLDSITSFKTRNSLRSPCEQLQRSQALKTAATAAGPAPAALQQGASGNRPPAAFFFRDPSMRLAYLGPSESVQYSPLQQQTLVEPAPAEAEGTGPTDASPSPSPVAGSSALPCTDLPVNIFAVLARDGYIT